MAAPNQYTGYKTNVGRTVTKKWKEANQISYDGDDWGDSEEYDEPVPVSASNARLPAWGAPPNFSPSNRSVTNPSPSRSGHRPSFDHGDERRHFSASAGFDSPYPTTQRAPFAEPQHDLEPSALNYQDQQIPLRLNTQGPGPIPAGQFRPGSRGRQYSPYNDGPYSAPGSFPQGRRSGSGNRPPGSEIYQRHESPLRPDSRSSNASGRQLPPRKSSLSQSSAATELGQGNEPGAPFQSSASDDRPIPVFVRPSDIYKRMPEEMEKVRKSQESSRPSVDFGSNRPRDESDGAHSTSSDPKDITNTLTTTTEDSDSTRRLKTTLDTVPERKSEYGFENLTDRTSSLQPGDETLDPANAAGVSRHPTTASSVYSDRPDPVSASTISRNVSLGEQHLGSEHLPNNRPSFGLPSFDRMSSFGMDLSALGHPGTETAADLSQPDASSASNVPTKEDGSVETRGGLHPHSLQHQPTLGYRSVVQQAFDESENPPPFSPTSASGTIDRSNSASTAEISPIIGRHVDHPALAAMMPQTTHPTIPEELSQSDSRPTSTATLKPRESLPLEGEGFSPPATIRSGYRRDVTPPSRDNSPAKRPVNVAPLIHPDPQHGSLEDQGNEMVSREGTMRGRAFEDKPLPPNPVPLAATFHSTVAPIERDLPTREDPIDPQSNAQNNNANQIPIRSPIERPESPVKETVHDIAKLPETPVNIEIQAPSPNTEQTRPEPQSRLDSFRPPIPGGWHSYASSIGSGTPGSGTPLHHQDNAPQFGSRFAPPRVDSTESIPTAKAPEVSSAQDDGVTRMAFAAAASAGSALAGALTGHQVTHQPHDPQELSRDSSENEWDASSTSSIHTADPVTSQTPLDENGHDHKLDTAEHTSAPTDFANDAITTDSPSAAANPTYEDTNTLQSTLDYFPAPLRTSRTADASNGRPSIPDISMPQETPVEGDNEQLQREIVKSLTPKSSSVAGESADLNIRSSAPSQQLGNKDMADTEEVLATTLPQHVGASAAEEPVMPTINTNVAGSGQGQSLVDQGASATARPFLQQRFSWETGSSQPLSSSTPKQLSPPPSTNSPDTIRAQIQPASTSLDTSLQNPEFGAPVDQQRDAAGPPTGLPTETSAIAPNDTQVVPLSNPADEAASFRAILKLGTAEERISAFNESRRVYAAPNGQLENWLLSMRTPEHSDLFTANGRISQDAAENATFHKPSPRRILTESAGARHMQEDGKRLMAAAGRFGGKAGIAAKGFFAKGKEKMRNASSGEKGLRSNRRKSTGPLPTEPDDVFSPSLPRDSTFHEDPPQIPFTISPASPMDWFSNAERQRSRESDLYAVSRPAATDSSEVSENQAPTRSDDEHSRGPSQEETSHAAAAATTPAALPSPAISALDSDHQDDIGVPSRSVSQLTRPIAEDSAFEYSHPGPAERPAGQQSTAPQHLDGVAGQDGLAPHSLAAPGPFLGPQDASRSDVHSSDKSLNVPQARRRSVVSEVSSASPSPGPGAEGGSHLRRSISLSPADEVPGEHQHEPQYPVRYQKQVLGQGLESSSVGEEGQGQPAASGLDDDQVYWREEEQPRSIHEPPLTQAPHHETGNLATAPSLEHQPQQPAQQQQFEEDQHDTGQSRAFSFAGIEGVGEVHSVPHDLSQVPTLPLSPVSQSQSSRALSKEMSSVSVEEVVDPENAPGQRHSRSYSRPFGADPNVRNHPAFRSPEPDQPAVNRAQMYSSESPLPSARRAPDELDRRRQPYKDFQHVPVSPRPERPAEEGYRIPGPYVQEYRSPKQISAPKAGRPLTHVHDTGRPLPSALRSHPYPPSQPSSMPHSAQAQYTEDGRPLRESYQSGPPNFAPAPDTLLQYDLKPDPDFEPQQQSRIVPSQRHSMGPPPLPIDRSIPDASAKDRPKKGSFGGLFGGSSKSRSKLKKPGRVGSPIEDPNIYQKEKRNSIFRRNSKPGSISSQRSSQHGGQDQLGQLPPSSTPTHSARRHSRELLTGFTHESNDQPPEGKKKRFSGFGARLFKSGSSSKSTSAPVATTESSMAPSSRQLDQQYPSSTIMSSQGLPDQNSYGQFAPGQGVYFHPGAENSQRSQSAYPQSPGSQQMSPYQRVISPYQHHVLPSTHSYAPPPQDSQPGPDQQPLNGPYRSDTYPYMNPEPRRPSDLRIDTSNGNRRHSGVPATAPAQIYPPRDAPFTTAPTGASHNPNGSPGVASAAAPSRSSIGPGTLQQNPASNQTNVRAHVIDLHKRSRSPRLGRPPSDEFNTERPHLQPEAAPASNLGTFSLKKISPVGGIPRPEGDQERPYAITVPGLDDDDQRRKREDHLLRGPLAPGGSETPVSVESGNNAGNGLDRNVSLLEGHGPPSDRRSSARDKTAPGVIVELPGSKAEGYESEEEIPMSATAYPGQEWMPAFVADD